MHGNKRKLVFKQVWGQIARSDNACVTMAVNSCLHMRLVRLMLILIPVLLILGVLIRDLESETGVGLVVGDGDGDSPTCDQTQRVLLRCPHTSAEPSHHGCMRMRKSAGELVLFLQHRHNYTRFGRASNHASISVPIAARTWTDMAGKLRSLGVLYMKASGRLSRPKAFTDRVSNR